MNRLFLFIMMLCAYTAANAQNPILLKDVYPGATGSGTQQIVKTSNYIFFNADDDDADADRGLYRTDGSASGTIKLTLSYPGYISTKAEKLTPVGNKIVFAGDNISNYGEIWASDGTQAGTVAIERFQPTTPNVVPVKELNTMGSYVYYSVVNGGNKAQLKRTDGTVAGTSLVYEFSAFAGTPEVVFLTPLNNILYFILYDKDGTGVDQLWRSDGTPTGTSMVFDFGLNQYVASYLMVAGNNMYVMIVKPGTGNVLWKSDGTAEGTVAVKTIGTSGNNNYPPFAAIGSTLYFAGLDGNGKELWKTDGTNAGTIMVADINTGAANSNPASMAVFNNTLYFSATTPAEGNELWKFNGATASLVKDIFPGTASGNPFGFTISNNTMLFRAAGDASGSELWITDGTTINTKLVKNMNPTGSSAPSLLTAINNTVYFTANNGIAGQELYKYDNTEGIAGLNKIYVNDNSQTSDVFTTAIGDNANTGTRTSPVATVTYALSIAQPGDTIYIDAGSYTEIVDVTKDITLRGAGMGITILNGPAGPVTPFAGTFETGIIQSIAGVTNVIIENMTIDGAVSDESHGTFIQGGGRISNCELRYVNDGFYFQYISNEQRTAVGNNNYVHHVNYVGALFAGNGLSVTASNNVIDLTDAIGGMGFIAGYGGTGNVASFTASNNKIIGFKNFGILVGSIQTAQINNNSLTRIAGNYIQNLHTVNVNATCNWYGTALAASIAPQITGNVTFSPWLIDGTDNSTDFGFQSSTTCPVANSYYVNDNNTNGDVFTTAVGNNINAGTFNAPYATLDYALTQVPVGATIYVDAGAYTIPAVSITKSVTILGPNHTISPNGIADKTIYNTARNTEAVLIGGALNIGADWILMNGLRFTPTTTAINMSGDFSHIKFNNNCFDVAGSFPTVILQGSTSSPSIVAFDFMATDNRFERLDNGTGVFLLIGNVKSLWVDNNTLIESGPIFNRSIGLRTLNPFSVEGLAFTNNYLKKLNQGVNAFILQNSTISSNKFDSTSQGIIYTPSNLVSNNVSINNNQFTNLRQGRAVLVRGGSNAGINNLNVSNNTINLEVNGTSGIIGLIQLEFAAANSFGAANVIGNKINISGDYSQTPIGSTCGIILTGKHANTTVSFNELNFTAINAKLPGVLTALPPVPVGIFINTDGTSANGLIPASAVINIANNKINGFKQSVAIYDPIAGITPQIGYGYLTTGATLNINNNSFTGDSLSIDNGLTSQSVSATCNWYGSASAELVIPKLSINANYSPWLTNGTDNDVATGFQPLPNVCSGRQNKFYVNDASQTGDVFTTAVGSNSNPGTAAAPFATPDYAYSIAQPGDTIYVDAGTYNLGGFTYSFPKAITFLGANYQISPNDASNKLLPNATRNAESIFTNGKMLIASNDISIEGFTWDVGNRTGVELANTALTNNDFGNFRFVKNIYKITHTNANLVSFLITGKFVASPAMPVTSGFTIEDNRFEKSGSATGTTVNFNYVKNILVKNNSFVVTGSTFRTQQIANLGNTGIVELFNFSDNIAENAGIVVNSNRVASAITSGNKLINTDRALNVSTTMPESSSIEFSNNIVETTIGGGGFVGYNRNGTSIPGSTNTFKVENNVFTGVAVPDMAMQLFGSMNFTVGNSVRNPSFIIRGNKIDYSGDFSLIANEFIRPITVRGNIAELTLESNEIVLNNTGSSLYPLVVTALPPNPAITINTDFSATSFMPANPVITILHNKVQGFKQSVVFYDATTGGKDSYQGYGNLPAGATVYIHNNSFTGDSISINNGNIGASVNATCNWFGTAAVQTILTKVSSNSAQIFPYLTDGTDTDAATGFQPTANTCDGSIPLITLNSFTNATCNGAANGTVNITASLGKAPFVFTWTKVGDANFVSNNEDPTNFSAGTYRLAITDANSTNIYKTSVEGAAGETLEVIITEPSIVTASITNNSTACSNIATVTAGGGTPGYTYLWSNGATSATISGVPVGTYTVIVTDANGCTATTSVSLTVSEAFNPSASVTNITCFGANNGIVTVTNINGAAPFMFSKDGGVSFENGSLPFSFTNLAPGNYTIAVKDANGCVGFVERTITQPTALTATIGTVQSTCFGASTGAINVSVSGGVAAYSYSWTKAGGGFTSSQLNISGLAEGNYTLTVTDKNNCTYSIEVNVPTNPAILVNETINNVSCRGGANGSIAVNVSGGSNTNFSYLWNTGATTASISNLAPGNYSVRITDNGSGCFVNKSYTIIQPATVLSLATAKTNATGCNSLGTITATGSGGTAPYTYSVNGSTINGNSIGGLYGGDYNITVTDANGCTTSRIVAITDNGSDEFEGNNSRNQAKPISVGTAINARLALSNDAADWFTFTAPGSTTGLYSIKIMHPTAVYTVAVFASGKNTTALVPVSVITNGERHYQLTAGATYFVSITTTTLSYICYNFSVSALEPIEGAANRTESKIVAAPTVEILKAFTYPNPHNGDFTLSIESPEEGVATVELYTVNGQKLSERKANVVKGKGNTLKYSNMKYAILFYKVRIGLHTVTGKIISPN